MDAEDLIEGTRGYFGISNPGDPFISLIGKDGNDGFGITLSAGTALDGFAGQGGDINISAGNGFLGTATGGNVVISAGNGALLGTGKGGDIILDSGTTGDPAGTISSNVIVKVHDGNDGGGALIVSAPDTSGAARFKTYQPTKPTIDIGGASYQTPGSGSFHIASEVKDGSTDTNGTIRVYFATDGTSQLPSGSGNVCDTGALLFNQPGSYIQVKTTKSIDIDTTQIFLQISGNSSINGDWQIGTTTFVGGILAQALNPKARIVSGGFDIQWQGTQYGDAGGGVVQLTTGQGIDYVDVQYWIINNLTTAP